MDGTRQHRGSGDGHPDVVGFSWDAQAVPPGGDHLLGLVSGTGGAQTYFASWDVRSGALAAVRAEESGGDAALSPDGRVLMEARDGRLAAYDLSKGDVLGDPPVATRQGVARAVMSARGLVAASLEDGRVTFFQGRRLAPVGPLLQETPGQVEQLTFSRDGSVLAVRTATGSLRLVDAASRLQLGEPIDLGLDRARVVALRPDGREVAVRTDDGVRIWDLRPQRWARAVCEMVGRSLTRSEWSTYLSEVGSYRSSCP